MAMSAFLETEIARVRIDDCCVFTTNREDVLD